MAKKSIVRQFIIWQSGIMLNMAMAVFTHHTYYPFYTHGHISIDDEAPVISTDELCITCCDNTCAYSKLILDITQIYGRSMRFTPTSNLQ